MRQRTGIKEPAEIWRPGWVAEMRSDDHVVVVDEEGGRRYERKRRWWVDRKRVQRETQGCLMAQSSGHESGDSHASWGIYRNCHGQRDRHATGNIAENHSSERHALQIAGYGRYAPRGRHAGGGSVTYVTACSAAGARCELTGGRRSDRRRETPLNRPLYRLFSVIAGARRPSSLHAIHRTRAQ